MPELSIPSGWNLKHQREDLPEKANPDDPYRCMVCQQRLQVILARIDPDNRVVRQHFRHHKDVLHRQCIFRTREEIEDIRREAIQAVREAHQQKRLRVFLERRTYGNDYELRAEIPALSDDDVRGIRMATSKGPAEVITIRSKTARSALLPQLLLPSQGSLRITLDAVQSEHEVTIDGPTEFSIKGTWRAKNMRHAVFLGQESAEKKAAKK
jgi:hypothetical protein